MHYRPAEPVDEYVARLETGADWRAEIEALADAVEADAGWFTGLGAVSDARLWFYDQVERAYAPVAFDEPLEVAACVGNVSLLPTEAEGECERFAHTHVVCSRPDGSTVAGHLDSATVFAGEVHLRVFERGLEREHHEPTGLDLWDLR